MKVIDYTLTTPASSGTDITDLTDRVAGLAAESGVGDGMVLVFAPGSTAAVTTIEYESGVIEDLKRAVERLAPEGVHYDHDRRWGDGNGYAHVRAALIGPSLTAPLTDGRLVLGTWQQIVLLDFDNKPRQRRVLVKIMGE
jgi:secondary thiamine-phosphate synthase enzyme